MASLEATNSTGGAISRVKRKIGRPRKRPRSSSSASANSSRPHRTDSADDSSDGIQDEERQRKILEAGKILDDARLPDSDGELVLTPSPPDEAIRNPADKSFDSDDDQDSSANEGTSRAQKTVSREIAALQNFAANMPVASTSSGRPARAGKSGSVSAKQNPASDSPSGRRSKTRHDSSSRSNAAPTSSASAKTKVNAKGKSRAESNAESPPPVRPAVRSSRKRRRISDMDEADSSEDLSALSSAGEPLASLGDNAFLQRPTITVDFADSDDGRKDETYALNASKKRKRPSPSVSRSDGASTRDASQEPSTARKKIAGKEKARSSRQATPTSAKKRTQSRLARQRSEDHLDTSDAGSQADPKASSVSKEEMDAKREELDEVRAKAMAHLEHERELINNGQHPLLQMLYDMLETERDLRKANAQKWWEAMMQDAEVLNAGEEAVIMTQWQEERRQIREACLHEMWTRDRRSSHEFWNASRPALALTCPPEPQPFAAALAIKKYGENDFGPKDVPARVESIIAANERIWTLSIEEIEEDFRNIGFNMSLQYATPSSAQPKIGASAPMAFVLPQKTPTSAHLSSMVPINGHPHASNKDATTSTASRRQPAAHRPFTNINVPNSTIAGQKPMIGTQAVHLDAAREQHQDRATVRPGSNNAFLPPRNVAHLQPRLTKYTLEPQSQQHTSKPSRDGGIAPVPVNPSGGGPFNKPSAIEIAAPFSAAENAGPSSVGRQQPLGVPGSTRVLPSVLQPMPSSSTAPAGRSGMHPPAKPGDQPFVQADRIVFPAQNPAAHLVAPGSRAPNTARQSSQPQQQFQQPTAASGSLHNPTNNKMLYDGFRSPAKPVIMEQQRHAQSEAPLGVDRQRMSEWMRGAANAKDDPNIKQAWEVPLRYNASSTVHSQASPSQVAQGPAKHGTPGNALMSPPNNARLPSMRVGSPRHHAMQATETSTSSRQSVSGPALPPLFSALSHSSSSQLRRQSIHNLPEHDAGHSRAESSMALKPATDADGSTGGMTASRQLPAPNKASSQSTRPAENATSGRRSSDLPNPILVTNPHHHHGLNSSPSASRSLGLPSMQQQRPLVAASSADKESATDRSPHVSLSGKPLQISSGPRALSAGPPDVQQSGQLHQQKP